MKSGALIKNNRGAVLFVVLFVLILLVGLAYAFTLVAVTTYQTSLDNVNSQQATYEAESAAQVITDYMLSGQESGASFVTTGIVAQLNSSATGRLDGTYSTPTGESGVFQVYYPDPNDKKTINITVIATVGEKSSSVTTVIRGTPLDIEDYISDYNIYITAPQAGYTYNLQQMQGADGPLTLYISTTETNQTFYTIGKFPQYTTADSQVTVSGDIYMSGDNTTAFDAMITVYGNLTANNIVVGEAGDVNTNLYVRDNMNLIDVGAFGNAVCYGNATFTASAKNCSLVGTLTSGGRVNLVGNSTYPATAGGIRAKSNVSVVYGQVGSSGIQSNGNVTIENSTVSGDIINYGNVTLINSIVSGSIHTTGNVLMQSSTVNGSLKTEGNLTLDSGQCKIKGDCVIDGSLTTCMLGSTWSQTTYHEFGSGTGNKLVIGEPTGAWDRTEQAVILFNSYVYGTLITDYKVVFTDDATVTQDTTNLNAHCRKSYINTLYVKQNYYRLSGQTDVNGSYLRMYSSTINNLYIVDNSGNRYDTVIYYAYIANMYGKNLNLHTIYQAAGGTINGNYVRFYNTTSSVSRLLGSIYSTGKIQIDGNTHFGDGSTTANLYAANGFSTGAVTVTTNTRNMNVYAGGTVTLAGPVGNLYLASNVPALTVNATFAGTNAIGGSLISESTNAITIASGAIITGNVDSKGVITTEGNIGGTLTTTSTVTVNGGTIGTTSAHQLYCTGLTDNGGATINANIYNNSSNALTLRSALNGSIYTKGNLTVAVLNGDAIEGNVRADGTGETAIKRSVTGSIQTSGGLNMYDGAATGLTVGGNVKATYALFYSVTVNGNVQCSGKDGSNYSVRLESAYIRGTTYSSSDGTIRLGGGCTLGAAVSGQDVVYSNGQVNFSAWNTAYGDVHCVSFYSYNTSWEGSGNHINGTLEANNVYINHVSSTYNAGSSSYNGIYCNGNVDINGLAGNGTIGFVRGSGSININNYSISGEVFGPANITLTNASSGKVYACDSSAPSVSGYVKLLGTSPVSSDVWSLSSNFEQSASSPIGGRLRIDQGNSNINYINANIGSTCFGQNSAKFNIASGITIGGVLYATSGITMGDNVTVNNTVCCYNGTIVMGNNCTVTGNIITDLSSGSNLTTGTNCSIGGTVYIRGSITTGAGTTISGNAKSTTTTITLNGNVGGSVYGTIVTTGEGVVINGDVTATSTSTSIIRGSVKGNIYTSGPLTISASSGANGSRQIGSSTANTLRCSGTLSVASQYTIYGSVNNTTGNMTIGYNVGGSVECPNGTCSIGGSIGGNLRSTNTTTVNGSIAGNVYVYNSALTPTVSLYGNVGGAGTTASIKGNLYQYATISGTLIVQGGYYPDTSVITSFPSLSISGDMTLNFPSGGSLGDPGSTTNITGVLTIISGGTVNVYGKIICGYLRVNKTNSVSDIYTRNTMISSFGGGSASSVVFYDEVHVQNNAYVLGATFNKYVNASNPGSTLFVGNHLATRDSIYYARGYVSSTSIATSLNYGSFSVGYRSGSGSVVTQGVTIYSRTQVKGDAYYLHSSLSGTGATTDVNHKMTHFIGGNLTLEGARMYAQGGQYPSYDTLIIVGGNCYLRYYSTTYPTYIGHPDALSRKGYKDTYEGLYVNGILSIEKDTAVYVDTYATNLANSGLIQIGTTWKWGQ